MHLQPVYADARVFGGSVSERLFATGVTLPSGAGLRDAEVDRVVDILTGVLG
jgi:dTDP-4-amino-4,6-dideoxygalactose transaminase